ncbi:hypothetical protein AC622_18050 [Bacillus sp. FJAT-27916]|uniref:hypothetical protein n=1 Tax=Bacillaceae TaxID=186817 RepID=UPI0006711F0A|nr:hypothetical protein [Bacillus sp. FJAT-27916]KMY45872.1 hypothetical protein AC622_18050 [Bacillus sp. FJAT-27916]
MKKINVIFCLLAVFSLAFTFIIFTEQSDEAERIKVEGIENFQPISNEEGNYLLFYPADIRVNQENLIIKEVNSTGEIMHEYEVIDSDFRRMIAHQKPNDQNKLYVSLFGEATIDNYYYTYDISKKQFEKINLSYFDIDVGVDHIMHYGNDILFQTLVSYKTGEQNLTESGEFNVSISNYTNQMSFETEYGHVPKWTPILEFGDKIVYGTSGQLNEKGKYENFGIGVLSMEQQTIEYKTPKKNEDLSPIYSTEKNLYILDSQGKMYVYDKNFNYKTYEPFLNISADYYYSDDSPPLFIDENRALISISDNETGPIIGMLSLEPTPKFKKLDKNYIQSNSIYRFLYQNINEEEIYVVKSSEKKESLLVLDNKSFDLITEIPIEDAHLLDFVVKN